MITVTTLAQPYNYQQQHYNGEDNQYTKDKKKSSGLNLQKLNCNNIIITGVDNHGQEPAGNMLDGGMTGEQDDGTWQKPQWLDNGGKESKNIDKNIVNFCKNKNTKVVIVDEEEEQQPEPVNPDLAVSNSGSNSISILLNDDGDGTFTEAPDSPITVEDDPNSVATGFFNADSDLDLAVSNSGSNTVTILLGDGDGTFTEANETPIPVGDFPASVATGFFNADSDLDLAVSNFDSGTVTILLGDGTFTEANESPITVALDPFSIAVGEFNTN
ncbi:MAG: VCBS repeat-containing protein [Nitrososphaeraceae archaeon]|nr:VCBS repeat-containing protein [Nitrososphaeraceae archaeon]